MKLHLLVVGALLGTAGLLPVRAEDVKSIPSEPKGPTAQDLAAAEGKSDELSEAELEKLVGRIALFPDPLIAQILPASTYPLEIVMAARLAKEKESLVKSKPDEFQKEVEKQKWDASVKAVAVCPDALKLLNDNLDWTNQLGEAFLAQQEDVMQAIQTLRAKAQNNGVLKDSQQQTVMVEKETIRILPSDPDIVYVPQYDPQVVYVQQPASSTVVIHDDDDHVEAVAAGVIGFGAGIAMGAWLSNDCHWGHGGGIYGHGYPHYGYAQAGYINHYSNTTINNNFNRNNTINNANIQNKYGNFNGQRVNSPRVGTLPAGGTGSGSGRWQHNPEHRRGQGYQNTKAFDNARLGNSGGGARLNNPSRNGWGSSSGGLGSNRPSSGGGLGSNRPSSGSGLGGNRPSGGSSGLGGNRPSAGQLPSRGGSSGLGSRPSTSDRGAFGGVDRGSSTRQQSSRGNQSISRSSGASRPSSGASRPSGGASRPSGGASRPSGGGASRGGGRR